MEILSYLHKDGILGNLPTARRRVAGDGGGRGGGLATCEGERRKARAGRGKEIFFLDTPPLLCVMSALISR